MDILIYNELDTGRIPGFNKLRRYLEGGDFKSAEVKKVGDNLYRARLDRSDRLLFSIYRHGGESYLLLLEHIRNHAYEKSRFLQRGVSVDESKLPAIDSAEQLDQAPALAYVNPQGQRFHLLDKIISFDPAQQETYRLPAPLIVIGSAGSGKTALTLEKMKATVGDVLYLTRSPYLTRHARDLYYAHGYENPDQQIDFLSFEEYLETIQVPEGREITLRDFTRWFARQRVPRALNDPYQVFEEIKGVITGTADKAWLTREDYLGLGIKQSIFNHADRAALYELFEKYLRLLDDEGLFDTNIVSYQWLDKVTPRYDFVVVDEVQDLTLVQLRLILKALRTPLEFFLCGDSNQIVHPNFFSWSALKSHFHQERGGEAPADLLRILHTNYRNTPEVTTLANRILQIKQNRFGSIDRESNYLVRSNSDKSGEVRLLAEEGGMLRELNSRISRSARFAVIVMHEADKAAAREYFSTPLVFSIQEAKGLEYPNIILYNFTSGDEERFRTITRGVAPEDLEGELAYRRAKDKGDKSLEIYKFHINALYVAVTRAVENLYWIERQPRQRLFELLRLDPAAEGLQVERQQSSNEEWQREAARLEQQGKQEQAEQIRRQVLQQQPVPWEVLDADKAAALAESVTQHRHKKQMVTLFEYAQLHQHQVYKNLLLNCGLTAVSNEPKAFRKLVGNHYTQFDLKNPHSALKQAEKYGIDHRDRFGQTPLMIAALLGNAPLTEALIERGANRELVNDAGLNPLQIALYRACTDKQYRQGRLAAIYTLLRPAAIDIQVEGRMIRIDNHLMEFFLLNLMPVMFYTHYARKIAYSQFNAAAFESGDLVALLEQFPNAVLPERRKKRAYISGILARNEVGRDDRYNRRIFKRTLRGHYALNPGMAVRVAGQWTNVYRLIDSGRIAFPLTEMPPGQPADMESLLRDRVQDAMKRLQQ